MTERTSTPVAAPATEPKTPAKVATSKKVVTPKAKSSAVLKAKHHPSTAFMVKAAVKALAEKNGSSLQAIKKYIVATYKLDAEKLSPFIRKSLKSAVIDGSLIQVKGKGANGSFKLPVSKASTAKPKPKSTSAKKALAARKPAAKKSESKPAAKKEVTKVAQPKTALKAKKVMKSSTVKPKAPKPKKAPAPKAAKPAVK